MSMFTGKWAGCINQPWIGYHLRNVLQLVFQMITGHRGERPMYWTSLVHSTYNRKEVFGGFCTILYTLSKSPTESQFSDCENLSIPWTLGMNCNANSKQAMTHFWRFFPMHSLRRKLTVPSPLVVKEVSRISSSQLQKSQLLDHSSRHNCCKADQLETLSGQANSKETEQATHLFLVLRARSCPAVQLQFRK